MRIQNRFGRCWVVLMYGLAACEEKDAISYKEVEADAAVEEIIEQDTDSWDSEGTASDSGSESMEDDTAVEAEESAADENQAPAFYPGYQTHSPINSYVADRLWELGSNNPDVVDNVFMKVGASSTVSTRTLHCFAGAQVELGEYADLQDTLDFFLAGDAFGSTPFDRHTEAAKSGRTAGWVISGDPSPLALEFTALHPRFAIVHYGTNDMGMGATYAAAMPGFYENMAELCDQLIEQGVVPILTGITHRLDSSSAERWVLSYNAMIRGLAQQYQIPFIDLWWVTDPLDNWGLANDGLHLNYSTSGACDLSDDGLQYGYNVRNAVVLQALDRVKKVVIDGSPRLDEEVQIVQGEGSPEQPFVIHELPFTDSRNTLFSTHDEIDLYSGCQSEADESGAEYYYRLELHETTRLRAMVMDRGEVDIDIHLLDASGSATGCMERAHRFIERTLAPGVYYFTLDTWVDSTGEERSGEYMFAIVECDADDTACD